MSIDEKPNMVKIIEDSLGLSEDEARAFIGLYARGYVTSSRIAGLANISLEDAEKLVRYLES